MLHSCTKTCLTPFPSTTFNRLEPYGAPIKEIDMMKIVEVCLGMVQVSFVEERTTDHVGCSDQQFDVSSGREERSRMDLVRAKD